MGPEALAQVLSPLAGSFHAHAHPNLMVGLGVADDAAVYRIDDETAVVATLDFFPPLVDDPYTYGAIAAANAMSDIYAMGGEVLFALNIAAFPENLPIEDQTAILQGAADMVDAAGGAVAGGHTVWDNEPKFGMSVIGKVHPSKLFRKDGLRAGEVLFLTKPVGTGLVLAGWKGGLLNEAYLEPLIGWMVKLNRQAAFILRDLEVTAATDITGFGLLGHLWEMASRSNVAVTVEALAVPSYYGAYFAAEGDFRTGGEGRNRDWVGENITIGTSVDPLIASILFDPQTSGGLLFSVPADKADDTERAFVTYGEQVWRIGHVLDGAPHITLK